MEARRSSASQNTENHRRSRLLDAIASLSQSTIVISKILISFFNLTASKSLISPWPSYFPPLIVIIFVSTQRSEAILIQGSAIRCSNEGPVEVSFVFKDPCIKCECSNQVIVCEKIDCYYERCKRNTKCPPGQRLAYKNGHYCPVCLDINGYCRIEGKPFTVTNFDGFTYNYDGTFNHILTRDCKYKEFSVHLISRFDPDFYRYNFSSSHLSTISSSYFNEIVVRLKKIKVRLTRYGVKIGRKYVSLPYSERGIITIIRQGIKGIALKAANGLKLTWDGRHSVKVAVPKRFKKRTCGLCGNFNGNSEDDIMTKRGLQTSDMKRFFKSWKLKRFRKGWG